MTSTKLAGPLLWTSLAALMVGCSPPATAPPPVTQVDAPAELRMQVSDQAGTPTESTVADLVEHVSPAVVNITTTHTMHGPDGEGSPFDFLFPEGHPSPHQRTGAGTGFVIDPGGYVITNAHVVADADEVSVRLQDDRQFRATIVGRDRKLDLALLRLEGAEDLRHVLLGDSDSLRVGEQVVAVGNPFGLGHTVTMGIVSAKARSIGAGPYDAFIQTDASINPGNSGGPLFNLRGEVVGINTAIRAGADGIGFAIPVGALKDIVDQLKDKGFVERGKLGLAFQPVTDTIAKALGMDLPHGAMVTEILPRSSAARAGIEPGDVIIAVNDTSIHRAEELPRNVARHAPGSSLELHFLRDGKRQTVTAVLDKLEDDEGPPDHHRPKTGKTPRDTLMGIELEDAPDGGVLVTGMSRPHKGLSVGDVIVEMNETPIKDTAALKRALSDTTASAALLKVKRRGRARFVGIELAR